MANPLGSTPGIIVGVGVGTAAAAAIEPVVEPAKQQAWKNNPNRILDPGLIARLVAEGGVTLDEAHAEALLDGYGPDKVNALVYLAQTVPGFAEAMTIWRRAGGAGSAFDALWTHALNKQGMDNRYLPDLNKLVDEWLTPQQVALAIVRSLIEDPGLMPVNLDTSGGNVPAYPKADIDPLVEAYGGGISRERLRVMVGSIGLPMSTQQAANATFRGIIKRPDFNRSILEGDVRPEWADAIFEQSRQYPTSHDYIEDHLRGWSDEAAMLAGTEKHGMSADDTQILFRINGRPLSFHQVFIGLRRGGVYDGPTTDIAPAFLKSLQESNIRPEWYNLAWAQRESLPAAFVLRALTQGGDVTQDEAETILLHEGWPTDLAAKVAAKWSGGATTTATQKKQTLAHLTAEYLSGAMNAAALTTALVGLGYSNQQAQDEIALAEFNAAKADRTRAIKALSKRYVGAQLSDADARAGLARLGLPAGAIDKYLAAWVEERTDTLTTLSVSQIEKALKAGVFTPAQATTLLQELGEDAEAIQTIIASNPPKAAP